MDLCRYLYLGYFKYSRCQFFLPGGIGSFDLVILIGFESHGIPAELTFMVLMFYRLSYYFIPAVVGTPVVLTTLCGHLKTKNFFS